MYIETFLKHFDTCYRDFVEYRFPTFKESLPFFSTLPHEYFVYTRVTDIFGSGYLGYRVSQSGEAIVHFINVASGSEAFSRGEVSLLRGLSFDQFLSNDYFDLIKTIDRLNTPKVDEFAVLRHWTGIV